MISWLRYTVETQFTRQLLSHLEHFVMTLLLLTVHPVCLELICPATVCMIDLPVVSLLVHSPACLSSNISACLSGSHLYAVCLVASSMLSVWSTPLCSLSVW